VVPCGPHMPTTGSHSRRTSRSNAERQVATCALLWDYRHHHTSPAVTSRGVGDGFPGAVLLRENRLVFVTVASARGTVTVREQAWIDGLSVAGLRVEALIAYRDDLRPLTAALRPSDSGANRHPTNEKTPGSQHSPGAKGATSTS
jgi:hypothetical protein